MKSGVIRLGLAVFSIAFLVAMPLVAQEPAVLSSEVRVLSLMPHLSLLRDPSGSLTFEQTRGPEITAQFEVNREERVHYGFSPDTVWVRFTLQSSADVSTEWIAELAHTRFDWIDWFVVRGGELAEHREAGNLRPRDPSALRSRLPSLAVRLAPGETAEVFLRLQTRAVVRVPLKIYSPTAFAEQADRAGMAYLFCLGAFGVLCVMGIIFALFTKYRGSLVYSLSIVGVMLIFFGFSGYWQLLELPGWRFGVGNGLIVFNQLCMIALLMYLRGFFNLAETMPKTNRALKILQWMGVLFLMVIPFGPYRPLIQLVQLEELLFGALAMTIALIRFFHGDRTARFYLLAWVSFWGLLLMDIFQQWKFLPPPATPDLPTMIALVVSFTLFFMAMADRVREIREEKEALQRDMTDRLERQVAERTETLRKAKEEAEAARDDKAMFLANMSHEIRTPLSALVGLSQAMCKQSAQRKLPEDFTRMMEQIRSGGRYLNVMLTNLLDVSATETGKSRANRVPVALDEWSRSVRDLLEPIAGAKGVVLVWDDAALAGRTIESDPVRLTQILINLVHNAVKFTPPERRVQVRFEAGESGFAFEVNDEGPGLPEGQQSLYDAFEQSPGVVTGPAQGVGLGLYVVQTNAQLLDGRVSTCPGAFGGACFCVEFKKEMPCVP